jgi:hypothetical protein
LFNTHDGEQVSGRFIFLTSVILPAPRGEACTRDPPVRVIEERERRDKMIGRAACFGCVIAVLAPSVLDAEENAPLTPGRYQIVLNPQARADMFLLDTATGRVWRLVNYPGRVGEPTVWEWMDRLDGWNEFEAFMKGYPPKAPTEQAPAHPAQR